MYFASRNLYTVRSIEELYAIQYNPGDFILEEYAEDEELNLLLNFIRQDFNQRCLNEDYFILSFDLLDQYSDLHEDIRDHIERLESEYREKCNQLVNIDAFFKPSKWIYFYKYSLISSLIAVVITLGLGVILSFFFYLFVFFSFLSFMFVILLLVEKDKEKREHYDHFSFKKSLETYIQYITIEIKVLNAEIDVNDEEDPFPGVPMSIEYGGDY